ncbi:Uncharacterized protein CLAVI_000185 [Candidatus Clavichlamydia salmonicola]|uniref:hypothetical protein n=1 Tax=Candidatus Clavichlamydia salmonicola TaxID=469812 RepID=UPI0018915448|nr:hypothetical protein [Candidatus Clavichlamydia salmonicola]MBF5050574.1 Uncharacterized protein [Candidatus Clavichlamydia salmonicola]
MHRFFLLRFFAWGSACIFYFWAILVALCGNFTASVAQKLPPALLNIFQKEGPTFSILENLFNPFEPSLERVKEDIQRDLVFCGINERPDSDKQSIYFQLQGTSKKEEFRVGQELKLYYAKKDGEGTLFYDFIKNSESKITIRLEHLKENEALFSLMKVSSQEVKKEFSVPILEKGITTFDFMINGQKVDNTLFLKQKARWVGKDLILLHYGGDHFSSYKDKERIDFEENGQLYTCFVKAGDYLIRRANQWMLAPKVIETENQPILFIRSVTESIMICELWDTEGLTKVVYSLIQFKDPSKELLDFGKEVHFVGMQSLDRPIIEFSNGKRIILDPSDWLLKESGQWKKISTLEDLDAYVERRSIGPLFVFEKIIKENKCLTIKGSLFNSLRSKSEPILLKIKKTGEGTQLSSAGSMLLKQEKERQKS